jgi:hypothetical protein
MVPVFEAVFYERSFSLSRQILLEDTARVAECPA